MNFIKAYDEPVKTIEQLLTEELQDCFDLKLMDKDKTAYYLVPEAAHFHLEERRYKHKMYACSVQDLKDIIWAGNLMIDKFKDSLTSDFVVRQAIEVLKQADDRTWYIRFRAARLSTADCSDD